jgi:hypothetical protein
MLVTAVNQYLGGPPPHYAFLAITAGPALGQERHFQARRRRAARL